MSAARGVLLAAGALVLPFGGAIGVGARSMPAPVIVPLDVTMEDADWLEAAPALAKSAEQDVTPHEAVSLAAEPDSAKELPFADVGSVGGEAAMVAEPHSPAGLAGANHALTGNEEFSESTMELLAVPPDFSISALAAVPSRTSAPLNTPLAARGQSMAKPITDPLARDQGQRQARTYKVTESGIEFAIPVQLDGDLVGRVPLKIGSDRNVSVELTELLALLRDRMDPRLHEWLGSAYSINSHISFDQLRSAGLDVRYDATNDIVVMATN